MRMRLGVGDALVQKPGVQLVIGLEPQPRREEALAHQTGLVPDLPLSHPPLAFPSRFARRNLKPASPDACSQAAGSTRWCEHIWAKRRLYCRSLPAKIASAAVFMLS